jgi:hypothetical protein
VEHIIDAYPTEEILRDLGHPKVDRRYTGDSRTDREIRAARAEHAAMVERVKALETALGEAVEFLRVCRGYMETSKAAKERVEERIATLAAALSQEPRG